MNAHHTLVCGDSGGGKSTLLTEMHDRYPGLSIVVDPSGDFDNVTHLEGASTVRSLDQARRSNSTKLRLVEEWNDALEHARTLALEYHEKTGWPTQIVVDEAQEVMGEKLESTHPLKRMLHRDRDKALKAVIATQDPTDLRPNYPAVKQCSYITWVGEWSVFHDGFIRYFNVPREQLPTDPYRYVVFDKRMAVQAQGETKEEYGA